MKPQAPEINRIYTGDALQVLSQWPNSFADMVLTDPPYGNDTAYGQARRRIRGDEHPLVGLQGIAATYRMLKRDATAYVFCGAHHVAFLEHFFLRYSRFRIRELLIWNKQQPGFGYTFRRAYECILVLEKGQPHYRTKSISTVMTFPRADTKLHPHAKPLPLLSQLISVSSDPGQIVLDPFAGIGSTCLAAQQLDRQFIGIELDPNFAAIARTRVGPQESAA